MSNENRYSCEGCGETFPTGIAKATHCRSCDDYADWKGQDMGINILVPGKLNAALIQFIEIGTYADISDFGRGAFREKLSREAPWILENIHKEPEN